MMGLLVYGLWRLYMVINVNCSCYPTNIESWSYHVHLWDRLHNILGFICKLAGDIRLYFGDIFLFYFESWDFGEKKEWMKVVFIIC